MTASTPNWATGYIPPASEWNALWAGKADYASLFGSVKDFGARGDGSTDDTAAINTALAALPSTGGMLFFPAGTYVLSSQIVYTLSNANATLRLVGAGMGLTTLSWAGGGGLSITCGTTSNSVQISDMSFVTGTNGSGTGLTLSQSASNAVPSYVPISTISNVAFHGSDGWYRTHYWAQGISVTNLSNINYIGVNVIGPSGAAFSTVGAGIALAGSSGAQSVVHNFIGCQFNLVNVGITYGTYVQGVTLSQVNITGCSYGIYNTAGGTSLDQLAITNSQFNCSVAGIYCATAPLDTLISNNLFLTLVANAVGVELGSPQTTTIVSNSFRGNGLSNLTGILLSGTTTTGGVITGNSFFDMAFGIGISANVSGVNVQSNVYYAVTTHVNNLGSNNTIGGGSQ
jgi:Pectate lyase superfamily protein